MLKKLLGLVFGRRKAKAKKKLKRKIRRFFRRLLLLALLGCSAYMAFLHRKLIAAKLFHKEAPQGECPRKKLFGKKK